MIVFEVKISESLVEFFKSILNSKMTVKEANVILKKKSGIKSFFNDEKELSTLLDSLAIHTAAFAEPNRRAYGDFQTNQSLAGSVANYLTEKKVSPEFVLEPTCGKGRFIFAALQTFKSIKKIVGIEIHYPYVWETKFGILDLFLNETALCKPEIEIIHEDIFIYDLDKLAKENKRLKSLVIGNPPWVTNSELSTLNSKNLPKKSNFKQHKGLDAITGKGNFDIGEYISLKILKAFNGQNGFFAFLIKSSVVKNILSEQMKSKYTIGNLHKLNIDAKKEFNVSVDACLFFAKFNADPAYTCHELDFYSKEQITEFGWQKDKFVYSIKEYNKAESIDGKSMFVWRQGMKHDCSKIMELDCLDGQYINGFKEKLNPETDLLYGLLKSSDLKHRTIDTYRKTTIVTQKKIGQDTSYIETMYPNTFKYLDKNRAYFDRRKSSIYRGKPPFSIFGIGDYSFAKYKVAISGMYKRTTFSLVLPEKGKPLMLDDTCYFIGFDSIEEAKVAQRILNGDIVQSFLKSIIFFDAKRPITKDILMRIDFKKAYDIMDKQSENQQTDWKLFRENFNEKKGAITQMNLF